MLGIFFKLFNLLKRVAPRRAFAPAPNIPPKGKVGNTVPAIEPPNSPIPLANPSGDNK